MPALPLSKEQLEDASRLKAAWEKYKEANEGASQEKIASECGWKTQGSFNQYIHGKIPLNLLALLKMCKAMGGLDPAEISPSLASDLPARTKLDARLAKADLATRRLIEIALLEDDPEAVQALTPSLVSLVRAVKEQIRVMGHGAGQ